MIERLEAGTVPSNVVSVMVGIFADKKALLDGDATVRVEHAGVQVTVEMVRSEFERMKRLAVTGDAQSSVSGLLPPVTGVVDAVIVAGQEGQEGPKSDGNQGASVPRQTGDRAEKHALGEGGGIGGPAAAARPMERVERNFKSKEEAHE